MKKSSLCSLVVLLLAASPALAASIEVGTHYFLPNTPGQTIPIYVWGSEIAAGVHFNIQVANGGPELEGIVLQPGEGIDGPGITEVDLVGSEADGTLTIFGAVPHLVTPPLASVPQLYTRGIIREEPGSGVVANGLLATVTFDTTGFVAGSWDLFLSNTHNAPTTMPDPIEHMPIPLSILDGTITLASGPSVVEDGGFGSGTLEQWDVAGEGTAEVVEFPIGSGNHLAELTAGSGVALSQQIETPDRGFLASFDYAFESAGTLEIMLGSQSIGLIEATEPGDLQLARIQIDDANLMGLADVELAFDFGGQTGSQLLLDNISVRAIPEPTAPAMLLGLLAGVPAVFLGLLRRRPS